MTHSRERVISSDYMEWAKTKSGATYSLATSGVMPFPLAELPVTIEDLEINGPSTYGYEPLQTALARKCGVAEQCVVASTGTSMANHLALAATIEPGDHVLIENPTYELLTSAALYLGAEVRTFDRRFENQFRIDPDDVARAVTPKTRLIVITNLHNPTGAFTDARTLTALGEIATRAGARVLVDEVYLEAMFDQAPRSAFHLGDHFITTASLTKAYGLSGLRAGWILAEPRLARKIWRLNDLFGSIPVHLAERLSVVALAHLDRITARAKQLLVPNRSALRGFFDYCAALDVVWPEYGTIAFPRLGAGNVDGLLSLLREKYETTAVPGRFFGKENHFRIGMGGDPAVFREGLRRVASAIQEIGA